MVYFPNTIAVAQGKGGVGKTTTVSNVGGLIASQAKRRVLVIDLDSQNNTRRDFGMGEDTGDALLSALISGDRLPVVKDVRPRLDVARGGMAMDDLGHIMYGRRDRGKPDLSETLAKSLASVAEDYDIILIDTPPKDPVIVVAAMSIAAGLVIPTRSDKGSLDGLKITGDRFQRARQDNPNLRLLGVLLFAIKSNATVIEANTRKAIAESLGSSARIFEHRIRDLSSAAIDSRDHALLIHELEREALMYDKFAKLRGEDDTIDLRTGQAGAKGLAGDYWGVTKEIILELRQSVAATAGSS